MIKLATRPSACALAIILSMAVAFSAWAQSPTVTPTATPTATAAATPTPTATPTATATATATPTPAAATLLHGVEPPLTQTLPFTLFMRLTLRPSSPTVVAFTGNNRGHAAYELFVTNYNAQPMRIVALGVEGNGGKPFKVQWSGAGLAGMFSAIAGNYGKSQEPLLQPSETGVLFVFLNFDSVQDAPEHVVDTVTVERDKAKETLQRTPSAPITIEKNAAVIIDAPISGDDWLAANGPSNNSAHRRALIPLDGAPHIGQRFAIDWVKFGPDGNTYKGDPHHNSSYYAWNAPVKAAADGRVVAVKDGIPENTPDPADPARRAVAMNLKTIAGNNVIEDIGGGHYALYAHLRPGSIAVKTGDTVHRGEVLAHLGNTGNSTEPHLHFQVCDAPSFIASNGVPFEIDHFVAHQFHIEQKDDTPVNLVIEDSREVSDQSPMENQLDDFPK
ncbi:MAG: M23 family metallopeptidase [Candidatus Binataceae bacterium]